MKKLKNSSDCPICLVNCSYVNCNCVCTCLRGLEYENCLDKLKKASYCSKMDEKDNFKCSNRLNCLKCTNHLDCKNVMALNAVVWVMK